MKSDHATDFEFLVRQDELHHRVIEQVRRINENEIEGRKRREHLFGVLRIVAEMRTKPAVAQHSQPRVAILGLIGIHYMVHCTGVPSDRRHDRGGRDPFGKADLRRRLTVVLFHRPMKRQGFDERNI